MLTICIIKSHNSPFIDDCLESLRLNTKESYELMIFPELGSREDTLNKILAQLPGRDLVIVADDILSTKGWDKSLIANWKSNRILGFSMLYPGTNTIQDRGYRLVSTDGVISTEAIDRGLKVNDVEFFDCKGCLAVTGCFQAIPSAVSKVINKFPLEGCNRLGEFLYQILAIRNGFEVGVLGHFLEHHGKSTKQNPDIELRSESYLLEKKLWTEVAKDFNLSELVSVEIHRKIDQNLVDWFNSPGVIYGAGTITEFLGSKLDFSQHTLCSGLLEENGLEFLGKKVIYKDFVDWKNVNKIIITVEGKEGNISNDLKKLAPKAKFYALEKSKTHSLQSYGLKLIDE